MSHKQKTGQVGEQIAAAYLQQCGHTILATNWRYNQLEIDVISKIGPTLVFTEVKTRTGKYFGRPEDAVTKQKQKSLAKAADEYMHQQQYKGDIRFDIIAIDLQQKQSKEPSELLHLEDAFFPIEGG